MTDFKTGAGNIYNESGAHLVLPETKEVLQKRQQTHPQW